MSLISKLTDNLLLRNSLLNQEIEILYPPTEISLKGSKFDLESDQLLDKCIENLIVDHEFITKILWHRIYHEPLVMKFISMRHTNYANNIFFYKNFPNYHPGVFDYGLPLFHLI